jgi:hypothetical protein
MIRIYTLLLLAISWASIENVNAQAYQAPQDTAKVKHSPTESLSTTSSATQLLTSDSRLLGCAVKAAAVLGDTTKYNNQKGIPLNQIFSDDDLKYIANEGVSGAVALFSLINKSLPNGEMIAFKTDDYESIMDSNNPLVLSNLRAMVSNKPASLAEPQWKENVYQSYIARDYGTKLFNTITITAATTELRANPDMEIIDYDNNPITLRKILARNKTEDAAVLDFRQHTFPSDKVSETVAHENYKRALFELMRLQENDIDHNSTSRKLVADLAQDLKKGNESNTINALKNSQFFDVNVPGNVGPVLLTESNVINSNELAANAQYKAMELVMLVSLHYGERDAVKLFRKLIDGDGAIPARQSGFSNRRVNELTEHGAEKFKSLGFQNNKTQNMTDADLVLVAVSSPDVPAKIQPNAFLAIGTVGQTIVNNYSTTEETTITKNTILFNPRISLGSRHTEYRAAYDPIDYVPEIQNGQFFDQRGSKIVQNGVELRLESDIYFSNPKKIADKGVKPVIFPEFGVLVGIGTRSVGYDQASTTNGPLGPVPQFQSRYVNWGAHLGLNVGPVMLGTDATILSTPVAATADERFFDLSQGMTYYRYELLTHVWYLPLKNNFALNFDLDLVAETNNEGFGNLTSAQGTDAQIKSAQWYRDYNAVHAGGVYNQALATSLLNSGYVKASYPSDNYAAIKVGLSKSNFRLVGTAGLYNIHTRTGEQVYDNLVRNTLKGNLFGSIGLTYSFGSKSYTSKHTKADTYSSGNPTHNIQESTTNEQSTSTGPRDHYIFISK